MLQGYEGPLSPGMVFRHRSTDIRCEITSCDGLYVSARSVDFDGTQSATTVPYSVGSFRRSWLPERWMLEQPHTL